MGFVFLYAAGAVGLIFRAAYLEGVEDTPNDTLFARVMSSFIWPIAVPLAAAYHLGQGKREQLALPQAKVVK